jgi:phosphatidylserine/phosphatidylglycerophosphate/cardiolipin synthase-like enzyme
LEILKETAMAQLFKRLVLIGIFCGVLAAFGIVAYVIYTHQDSEHRLIKLLVDEHDTVAKAFFAPDDNLASLLIDLIHSEKKRIVVAIYTLTHKEIAQALVSAHKRGVTIEAVVDPGYGTDRYSKVPLLANDKIPVWVYQSSGTGAHQDSIMHNKFCVFEDNILHKMLIWTGSYNFTVRATARNQENVVILDNKKMAEQYLKQFEILKTRSLLISGPRVFHHQPVPEKNRHTDSTSLFKELRTILSI